MTPSLRTPAVHDAYDQLAGLEALDEPAKVVGKAVRDTVPAGPAKDALSGVWLGHALHPLLTDLPIGSYTSAVLLDWLGGRDAERAADRLIGLGLLFTLPTAATGMTEWADSEVGDPAVRRVGLVHAALNVGATALFGASLAARRGGARGTGRLLALAGAGLLGASGHLGGHLSYAEGVGVNQTTFEEPDEGWTAALRDDELPEGESRFAEVGGIGVLVARHRGCRPRALQPLRAPRRAARRGRAPRRLRHLPVAPVRLQAGGRQRGPGPCRRTRSRAGTPACATASSRSARTPAPRSPPPGSDPLGFRGGEPPRGRVGAAAPAGAPGSADRRGGGAVHGRGWCWWSCGSTTSSRSASTSWCWRRRPRCCWRSRCSRRSTAPAPPRRSPSCSSAACCCSTCRCCGCRSCSARVRISPRPSSPGPRSSSPASPLYAARRRASAIATMITAVALGIAVLAAAQWLFGPVEHDGVPLAAARALARLRARVAGAAGRATARRRAARGHRRPGHAGHPGPRRGAGAAADRRRGAPPPVLGARRARRRLRPDRLRRRRPRPRRGLAGRRAPARVRRRRQRLRRSDAAVVAADPAAARRRRDGGRSAPAPPAPARAPRLLRQAAAGARATDDER